MRDKVTDTLTFIQLREANTTRCPLFKDKRGNLAHPQGGDDWS